MKLSFILLVLLGSVLGFSTLPVPADDAGAPKAGANAEAPNTERMERMKAALEKLDLTDAQKAQIKQIRETTTDRRERFEKIMAVLTPEQKTKLRAMAQARQKE